MMTIVGDSDGLIALLNEDDINHLRAKRVVQKIWEEEAQVVFPVTTIVETITTLIRKLKKPKLAAKAAQQVVTGDLSLEPVDGEMLRQALALFNLKRSKKNTLFDALVAATAKKYQSEIIFSFDGWYKKLGLKLASEVWTVTA